METDVMSESLVIPSDVDETVTQVLTQLVLATVCYPTVEETSPTYRVPTPVTDGNFFFHKHFLQREKR